MILAACLAALLSGQGADTATSFRHGTGTYEANPLLPQSRAGIVAVKASVTTAVAVAGWRMRKDHPRLAIAMFLSGAASGSVGAWHNARITRKVQ
jgi:hypothetical protein